MTEKITVFAGKKGPVVPPETYGHFIEHLGHCIYDGIWVGKNSDIPNIDGVRKEAVDVFKAVKAPLIRWPGGYFADCYDWRDGIGSAESRPLRFHECEPGKEEPNQFGTHEFLNFCELVGAAPNLCVNTAFMTARDAMDWVEYCNHDGKTSMAELRRKNGREKPWNVKHWAIGNESYFLHSSDDYAGRFLLWRKFMRRVSPDIQSVACLIEPGSWGDWLGDVSAKIRGNMEMASIHLYSGAGDGLKFTEKEYWDSVVCIDQRNRQRIEAFLGVVDSVSGGQKVKLALDEWGIWHPGAAMTGVSNCEQPCPHRDALFAARYFHMLHGFADRIGMATIAQTVNVLHALLRTDGPRSYRTPTFHVFEMFKGHQGGAMLETHLTSPGLNVRDIVSKPDFICSTRETVSHATASATLSADGTALTLTMTNADLEKTLSYSGEICGAAAASLLSARVLRDDPRAQNTYDEPDKVRPEKLDLKVRNNKFNIELPPCSVVAAEFALSL